MKSVVTARFSLGAGCGILKVKKEVRYVGQVATATGL
jgi:hypothetical protein